MSDYTQDGPWIDAGLTGHNPRITGGPLRLVKCEGVVIAFLPAWLDDEHEEARANARLVVSAPDLLEGLIYAEEALRAAGLNRGGTYEDIVRRIAKATGKEAA